MLVAQSYAHSTMSSSPPQCNKRTTIRTSRPKKELTEKRLDTRDGRPRLLSSMTCPTSSKPVIIPTKSSTSKRKPIKEEISSFHDSEAIPPSMAALLAITSVHSRSSILTKRGLVRRSIQKERLTADDMRFTPSSSSPRSWTILQSPPEEEEVFKDCEIDGLSLISASTLAPLSYRSLSSDSMPSLDMESDYESPATFDPPTPAPRTKPESRKLHASRASLDDTEHPLSPPTEHEPDLPTPTQEKTFYLDLPPSRAPSPKSLKSNLTASIRLLKSAARTTLSTITPAQYTPNPLLSFSFSKPTTTTPTTLPSRPTPYLNPGPLILANIDGLPFHLTSPLPALPIASTSIQLLPYYPSPISISTSTSSILATAPPIFLPSTSATLSDSTPITGSHHHQPRAREPRENSDFLRIVVMEMNMRRAGKLNEGGRARLWLAARGDGRVESRLGEWGGVGEQSFVRGVIPGRWRGVVG